MAIHHMAFIKFKKDARKADIDLFIAELNRIPELDREVKSWVSGYSPEPRIVNGDFDFGFDAVLPDWDAMDRYMYHEAHVRMRQFAAPVVEHMMAVQFQADYVKPGRFPARQKQKTGAPRLPKGKVIVPTLVGRRVEDARQVIREAGLKVGTVNSITQEMLATGKASSVMAPGRVAVQEPARETIVDRGSAVNMTLTGDFWLKPERPRV